MELKDNEYTIGDMPMEEIDKCGDIHKIAKLITSEKEGAFVPVATTRTMFLDLIKQDIIWYMESETPPVEKSVLQESYNEILKIEDKIKTAREMVNRVQELKNENAECKTMDIKYILIDPENKENSIIAMIDNEKGIGFEYKAFTKRLNAIFESDFSCEESIIAELENGKEIEFMSNDMHLRIWCELNQKIKDEKTQYDDGIQSYMKYCDLNKITQQYLKSKNEVFYVPDIMDFYEEELENPDYLKTYTEGETRKILDSKERLVFVDNGNEEFVLKYEDLPDCIVDVNARFGSQDLKVFEYYNPSFEPILTTYGHFLNKCDPEVRADIIDRLVKLQNNEVQVKPYKVVDERTLEVVRRKMNKEQER